MIIGKRVKNIIITSALMGFLSMANAAKAQTFPSSPKPFYPPTPSGPLHYTPIPPQKAPSSAKPPSRPKMERGIINPWTGEFYPGTQGGVLNPRTGVFLPKVNGGYLDPETGVVIPEKE
jgi:hypothetical protein